MGPPGRRDPRYTAPVHRSLGSTMSSKSAARLLVSCAFGAVALTGLSCSEYDIKAREEPDPGGVDTGLPEEIIEEDDTAPLAAVSPEAVDLGVVCRSGSQEVTVENQGDAPLDVTSILAVGDGWTAVHADLPATLGPGETLPITDLPPKNGSTPYVAR